MQGNIPSFIEITDAKLNDVNILDVLVPEAGAIYVMDRAYVDYERLYTFHRLGSYFVVRAKSNTKFQRLYSHANDQEQGLIYDQSGRLTGVKSKLRYPEQLRRIKFIDREQDKTLVFLTNNTYLPALTIAQLYKNRRQVELFSLDQTAPEDSVVLWHQRERRQDANLDRHFGLCTGGNHKKRLKLDASLYTISQILDTALFDKKPLYQLLTDYGH